MLWTETAIGSFATKRKGCRYGRLPPPDEATRRAVLEYDIERGMEASRAEYAGALR